MDNFQHRAQFIAVDYACLGAYFVSIVVVSLVVMFRVNRATENGYFLAGRFMTWLPVGASLFASNIGSEHFIGLAGSGAVAGIAVGAFEFNASILLQLLGWVFLPVYIASRVTTLPQYMVKRFASQRICLYLSVLSLTLYVFTKISVNLYSGIIFVQEGFGWGQWIAVLILLGITGFCTMTGGLGAIMYTDTLQSFVMILGAGAVAILAFIRVGGYQNLYSLYSQAIPAGVAANNISAECNLPKSDAFRMLRGINDGEMPWLGFVFGQTPASIWYWAADQMMVQRTLAAKSLSHAQGGCILASFFKLLPMFLLVIPGMISRILAPDIIACANPDFCEEVCGNRKSCSNLAYPRLALNILPHGARGLMLGVMLAALMSDLTAIFNSASSLFTLDIYTQLRRTAKRRELMLVARLFIVLMVVVSVLWIPVIAAMQGGQMYIYIQSIAGYLSPPIAAVYLCAILWRRCNEQGAFWSLMISACIGFARMIADFIYKSPDCGDIIDTRPWFVKDIHYMYVAMILFWLTLIVCIVISLATAPPLEQQLIRTTYFTRHDARVRADETISNEFPISSVAAANDVALGTISTLDESSENGKINNKINPVNHEDNTKNAKNIDIISPAIRIRRFRRLLNWFCGLDATDEEILREETHVNAITSLEQNARAVRLLNVLLIVLVIITVFIYGYFSLAQPYIHPVPLGVNGSRQSIDLLRLLQ